MIILTIFLTEKNFKCTNTSLYRFSKILNESVAGKKAQNELKNRLDQTIKKLNKTQENLRDQEKQ